MNKLVVLTRSLASSRSVARYRPLAWRLAPSGAGLLMYMVFVLMRRYAPHLYDAILMTTDITPRDKPFNDLESILRAGMCWREGVNVYAPSACMGGGVFNYSPLMLWGAFLPVGPRDQTILGVLLGVALLASFAVLPPAGSRGELLIRIFAICSDAMLRALASANFDDVIFLLLLAGIFLIRMRRRGGLLGYAVFAFAAVLKFYPAIWLAAAVREPAGRFAGICVAVLLGGLIYLEFFGSGTGDAIRILPVGLPFFGMFGARDLFFGLLLLLILPKMVLLPSYGDFEHAINAPHVAAAILVMTRVLIALSVIAAMRSAPRFAQAWERLDGTRQLFFVMGALTIVFCFFAAQNIYYRAIFLILTLPALGAMHMQSGAPMRRRFYWLILLILFLLWEATFRSSTAMIAPLLAGARPALYLNIAYWIFRECVWWWVITQLCAILVCFFRAALERLLPRAHEMLEA